MGGSRSHHDSAGSDDIKTLQGLSVAELRDRLDAPPNGLTRSGSEAAAEQYGPNALPEEKANPLLRFSPISGARFRG